jgi:hypothetical protein
MQPAFRRGRWLVGWDPFFGEVFIILNDEVLNVFLIYGGGGALRRW